jgi:hypothetical protein
MDMERFEDVRDSVLQDNRPFIPTAEIKYIGWLTRNSHTKMASSVVVEFTRAEDAKKIIDEGLIWQGEVFQCERYDRQCRLRQCFKCHKYGHIGTQCKANVTCGYGAQSHPTKECPTRNGKDTPRKCATCQDAHEAWSPTCPVRKRELLKVKTAYSMRPRYHSVSETSTRPVQPEISQSQPALRSIVLTPNQRSERSRSPNKRGQKRMNPGNSQNDQENVGAEIIVHSDDQFEGHQRPRRNPHPSRRVLEALDINTQINHSSHSMDITEG